MNDDIRIASHARRGEITILVGCHTGGNVIFSLKLAEEIARNAKRGKVLYLNTVQTGRQLGNEIRKHIREDYSSLLPSDDISYMHCPTGRLNNMGRFISDHLKKGVKFVIVNSLEFSSKDSRRRNDLMFQCMTWAHEHDAAIIIMTESSEDDIPEWKIQRGGMGKFTGCCGDILLLDEYPKDLMNSNEGRDESEGLSYWMERIEKEKHDAEIAAAKAKEKKEQEEKLLAEAQRLAREAEFLAADIPIYKAYNEGEEKLVREKFLSRHHKFRKQANESAEHFRKRLLAAVAIDLEDNLPVYDQYLIREEPDIVHSADPDKPFMDELLPEGASFGDYFLPDKLPIRGVRKPYLLNKENARAKS